MPNAIGFCWRGVRFVASTIYWFFTSGVNKVIPGAMRRRANARAQLNDPADHPARRIQKRPAYNALQKGVLKRCIYKVQANDASLTCIKKLLERLERDMKYKGNPATLRRLLKELGIKPIVSANNKEYFLEKEITLAKRAKYLENVTKYRNEGRPIIYTNVSNVKFPRTRKSLNKRVVMAYAASKSGIIDDTVGLFNYDMPINEWYELIHYSEYVDWMQRFLIPFLPPNSVIIMRTTPWSKIYVTKGAMETWLRDRNIAFDSSISCAELRKLINLNKNKQQQKTIDQILEANGHTVLHLPYLADDLNPLEVIWNQIQEFVADTKENNRMIHILNLTNDRMFLMSDQMSEYYDRITLIENEYQSCALHAETIMKQMSEQESIATVNLESLNLEAEEVSDDAKNEVCDVIMKEIVDANNENSVAN